MHTVQSIACVNAGNTAAMENLLCSPCSITMGGSGRLQTNGMSVRFQFHLPEQRERERERERRKCITFSESMELNKVDHFLQSYNYNKYGHNSAM